MYPILQMGFFQGYWNNSVFDFEVYIYLLKICKMSLKTVVDKLRLQLELALWLGIAHKEHKPLFASPHCYHRRSLFLTLIFS